MHLPKTSIVAQIVSEMLAQLCCDDSIQITGLISQDNLPRNANFWQVGVLDIVLSEYLKEYW